MKNLEDALLEEEEKALSKPLDEVPEEIPIEVISLFPYLKHQPYIGLLIQRGQLLRLQESGASVDEINDINQKILNAKDAVIDAARQVATRYGINTTEQEIERYLLRLAENIVRYGEEKLYIFIDGINDRTFAFEASRANKSTQEAIEWFIHRPDFIIYSVLDSVKRFYFHETKK